MVRLSKGLCIKAPSSFTKPVESLSSIIKQQMNLAKRHSSAAIKYKVHSDVSHSKLKSKASFLKNMSGSNGLHLKSSKMATNDILRHQQHLQSTSLECNVAKILELLEENVKTEQLRAEWIMLGALIDRILLIVLIIAAVVTMSYIYAVAPTSANN